MASLLPLDASVSETAACIRFSSSGLNILLLILLPTDPSDHHSSSARLMSVCGDSEPPPKATVENGMSMKVMTLPKDVSSPNMLSAFQSTW